MSSTITRNLTRRILLQNTQVPVGTSKSVTSITRSGTTATITATSHGLSANDWFIVQGADRPAYNGPFRAITVPDANTITTTLSYDPGASAAGTITLEKVTRATIWGDGSVVDTLTSLGALPTAERGWLEAMITTTTAPTTACRMSVYKSPTGASGTWRGPIAEPDSTILANDQSPHNPPIEAGMFVLVCFWRVRGTAVYVDLEGVEETSHTVSP
jgi:hypothetical protein